MRLVALACIASLISACASSSTSFYANPSAPSDLRLCDTVRSSAAQANPQFQADVISELERRGQTPEGCARLRQQRNAAIGAALAAGALAYAASQDSGSGGYYDPAPQPTDHEWQWDEFYNENYLLIWRCRGVQTGQFAEDWRCAAKIRSDWKWPQKSAVL